MQNNDVNVFFDSLALKEWRRKGIQRYSGGQSFVIEVENITSKEIGCFRVLKRKEKEDVERFNRELGILIGINHPNIVALLDYSKDSESQWYISKKGSDFEEYWNQILIKHKENHDQILLEAINIILKLSEGLIELHARGVVHRDIKFGNIVVCDGNPVLIDFGIAFILGEERLTSHEDAVANRYSPDPSLNFMEDVPPWLDVFLLSQLLISMISSGTKKPHFQRPMDWRWVVYPNFSHENLLKVRALTAMCSNYLTAPKNASELKDLLDNLFFAKASPDSSSFDAIKKVKEVVQVGLAIHHVNFSDDYMLIQSRMPMFVSICNDLELGLKKIIDELKEDFVITIQDKGFIKDFERKFIDESEKKLCPTYQTIHNYIVTCGTAYFSFGFSYILYTHEGVVSSPQLNLLKNIPCISFTIHSNEKLMRAGKTKSFYAIPCSSGLLELYNGNTVEKIGEISVPGILKIIKDSIIDPDAWRLTYSI